MATIKTKFRPTSHSMGRIVYQIIHRREVKRITSSILIPCVNWDSTNDLPLIECPQLKTDLDHLRRIISRLDGEEKAYTAADVAEGFAKIGRKGMFFGFAEAEISLKLEKGCKGTAKNYRSALRQYQKFRSGVDIPVGQIYPHEMEEFQSWLVGHGVCSNTISSYMRPLRCIYNRAVSQGLCADSHPFANVYTGVAKTRKRAISERDIKSIARLDIDDNETYGYTRDLFMLSFYLMGIAFVDLAMLKKTDYSDGRITYRRQKTGQTISVFVCEKAKTLIAKMSADDSSPFLINIIKDKDGDTYRQYLTAMDASNRRLKKIAKLAGLACGITTYTPRHTWASLAKAKNVEISVISDALGHESETTTRIYLATIDTRRIDSAHELIIKGI